MKNIFKKYTLIMLMIVIGFLLVSILIVETTTKTLWTNEINLKIDNGQLNPFDMELIAQDSSNMIQSIFKNFLSLEVNKEYLEMVAISSPFVDEIIHKYGKDDRIGIFVDLIGIRNKTVYLSLKSSAPSKEEALKMQQDYLLFLKNYIKKDYNNKIKLSKDFVANLLNQKEFTKSLSSQNDNVKKTAEMLNLISNSLQNLINVDEIVQTYGVANEYVSVGSKFEKAVRIMAGLFAGLLIAILYVLMKERKNIIKYDE